MTDSILKRYATSHGRIPIPTPLPAPTRPDAAQEPAEEAEDCGAFGYLRGVRDRAIMLELRKKNGNIKALGYAWLAQVDYDPSQGITLHFGGQKVTIKGQNLNGPPRRSQHKPGDAPPSLLEALCKHRVVWIQEADEAKLLNAVGGTSVVEQIEIQM